MHAELVMKPEGFLTGLPVAGPVLTSAPNWPWSPCTFCTPGLSHTASMAGTFQELAYSGCSCRKYLPPSSCSSYRLATNSRCFLARAKALSMASTQRARARLRTIQVLKALHSGEPIRSSGFCSLKSALALLRLPAWLKSQGNPSRGSFTVRSSANPGATCFHLPSTISFVIRGGEYISETSLLAACLCSRTKRELPPSCCISSSAT